MKISVDVPFLFRSRRGPQSKLFSKILGWATLLAVTAGWAFLFFPDNGSSRVFGGELRILIAALPLWCQVWFSVLLFYFMGRFIQDGKTRDSLNDVRREAALDLVESEKFKKFKTYLESGKRGTPTATGELRPYISGPEDYVCADLIVLTFDDGRKTDFGGRPQLIIRFEKSPEKFEVYERSSNFAQ